MPTGNTYLIKAVYYYCFCLFATSSISLGLKIFQQNRSWPCDKIYLHKYYLIYVLKDDKEISKLGNVKEEARRSVLLSKDPVEVKTRTYEITKMWNLIKNDTGELFTERKRLKDFETKLMDTKWGRNKMGG